MAEADLDALVRLAAFEFLAEQHRVRGDVMPRDVLASGFSFRGRRVPLVGPQGIFKPAVLPELPLTITTAPIKPGRPRPYDDSFGADGLIHYRYRGTDPAHHENVGLREAMRRRKPLAYFHGIVPGRYFAVWPVYIVGDDPRALSFAVAADDPAQLAGVADEVAETGADARRAYVTAVTRRRLHQGAFRERVLTAYRRCCALCRLRHTELLDAAHIIEDTDPEGEPVVSNGLSLCKLHHAAFDQDLLAVRPDYVVEIRRDVLDEIDGPMLVHGLQGFHGTAIQVPRAESSRPDPARLEVRYRRFQRAS